MIYLRKTKYNLFNNVKLEILFVEAPGWSGKMSARNDPC